MPDNAVDEARRREILGLAKDTFHLASGILTSYTDLLSAGADRVIKIGELSISFHEKIMLLDGGAIVLSLSLIGALLPHAPHLAAHKSFLWLVCPAWLLLLYSIYCCWQRMAATQVMNLHLVTAMSSECAGLHIQQLRIMTARLRGRLTPEELTRVDGSSEPSADPVKQLEELCKHFDSQKLENMEKALKADERGILFARQVFWTTFAAFFLLCAFAVRAILTY